MHSVGIQVHDILAVDAQAALAAVHRIHLGEVILGLTQVDGLAGNLSGQSALSGLSSLDRLDLVVGIGEEDDLVVLETRWSRTRRWHAGRRWRRSQQPARTG